MITNFCNRTAYSSLSLASAPELGPPVSLTLYLRSAALPAFLLQDWSLISYLQPPATILAACGAVDTVTSQWENSPRSQRS